MVKYSFRGFNSFNRCFLSSYHIQYYWLMTDRRRSLLAVVFLPLILLVQSRLEDNLVLLSLVQRIVCAPTRDLKLPWVFYPCGLLFHLPEDYHLLSRIRFFIVTYAHTVVHRILNKTVVSIEFFIGGGERGVLVVIALYVFDVFCNEVFVFDTKYFRTRFLRKLFATPLFILLFLKTLILFLMRRMILQIWRLRWRYDDKLRVDSLFMFYCCSHHYSSWCIDARLV